MFVASLCDVNTTCSSMSAEIEAEEMKMNAHLKTVKHALKNILKIYLSPIYIPSILQMTLTVLLLTSSSQTVPHAPL
jgi:hypothetical protein